MRYELDNGDSRRMFIHSARRIHPKNLTTYVARGGIRL